MTKKRRVLKSTLRPETVGKRLQQLRHALGHRQTTIAYNTGISPPSWNKYERGAEVISVYHALEVARVTGATLDWIYSGRESDLSPQLARLLKASHRLRD